MILSLYVCPFKINMYGLTCNKKCEVWSCPAHLALPCSIWSIFVAWLLSEKKLNQCKYVRHAPLPTRRPYEVPCSFQRHIASSSTVWNSCGFGNNPCLLASGAYGLLLRQKQAQKLHLVRGASLNYLNLGLRECCMITLPLLPVEVTFRAAKSSLCRIDACISKANHSIRLFFYLFRISMYGLIWDKNVECDHAELI